MRKYLAFACCLFLMGTAALSAAASSSGAKKTTSSKKKPAAAKSKSPSKKQASTKKGSGKKTTAKARRSPSQRTPTQDRYRDIQQALLSKGYFSAQPDGNWGPSSVEALKRFQQDQSLEPSGRINSLSLIALGLGPKHEKIAAANPPEPPQPQPNQ